MQIIRDDLAIVSMETGEILDTLKTGDNLSLVRAEQIEYTKSHIQNFNSDKTFVKIYDDVVPLLEKYLTLPEFKFTICLTPHVSFEDCIIRRTMDRKSQILNMHDLAELHGYKYDYVRKIMSSLKNKGVIGRHDTGSILKEYSGNSNTVYTVNPYIFFRGVDILTPVHSFYSNSGWKELLARENKPISSAMKCS